MTTRIILASAAALLAGLLAGCGSEPENATDKPSEQPAAQVNILDGPIPSCERLTAMDDPAMKAYRIAAHRECAKARSFQEKMDNVGCMVTHKKTTECASKMKGSELQAWTAERKEALGE
ncbi:hypothetical protein I5W35_19540 [Stenotrophomonas maltophilia]|jgi:hypothetical protein|nr:hypothetical protein [Stenotrophomonas maltophilia]